MVFSFLCMYFVNCLEGLKIQFKVRVYHFQQYLITLVRVITHLVVKPKPKPRELIVKALRYFSNEVFMKPIIPISIPFSKQPST